MNPSVLILAEEMSFLLYCYSNLHQDARIGRVETVTGQTEAVRLLQTFRPDVVVVDSSAADSAGVTALVDRCKIPADIPIVVTCHLHDRAKVAPEARDLGAVGFFNRDNLSAEVVLRAARMQPGARPTEGTMSQAVRALRTATVQS